MILEDLKKDIHSALRDFILRHKSYRELTVGTQDDIRNISKILIGRDPLITYQELQAYIERIRLPVISWLPILERNDLYWTLQKVLTTNQYQEVNFLRQVVTENSRQLKIYRERQALPRAVDELRKTQSTDVFEELKILRKENAFLYGAILELNNKVVALEEEKNKSLKNCAASNQTKHEPKLMVAS